MRLSTLSLAPLLLNSCSQAQPQQPVEIVGPIVDTRQREYNANKKPTALVPPDHGRTGIDLDVIHNNINELQKRIEKRAEPVAPVAKRDSE